MQGLTVAEPKFPGDDGTADPAVRAALAAYAAGQGSEHAALTALARYTYPAITERRPVR